jgi:anti-sigma factor RsiW
MKDCRDVEPLKAPYVDGEAAPDQRSAVEKHIVKCGRCRDEVAVERVARDVVVARRDELRVPAPETLKARCAAHAASILRDSPRVPPQVAAISRPRAPIYRRWVPMSLAATLMLAVAGVFGLGLTQKAQALAFQLTLDHMGCSRSAPSPEAGVMETSTHWAEQYGWPLRLTRSSQQPQLRLTGLRRCFVADGRVAHLLYEWRGQTVSVFVLPSEALRAPAVVRRFGYDSVMWSRNGRTYIVLSRSPRRPDFEPVVQYVKANVY